MGKPTTPSAGAIVSTVDNDPSVRDSLQALFSRLNVTVTAHASAEDFLRQLPCIGADLRCIVVEANLPTMGGIELLNVLHARAITVPTIVLASHSDVALAVRAMRNGAVDFFDKPFAERILLERVRQVLDNSGTHQTT